MAKDILVSQEYFEKVILFLKRRGYQFIRVSDLSMISGRGKYVCLTFDDGFVDCYEYALPLLRKHQITATFYPCVIPCRDQSVRPLDIYYQCVDEMDLSDQERSEYYSGEVKKNFYWSDSDSQEQLLTTLFSSLPEENRVGYMNAQQIKEMADLGFEIGSHGMSHSLLTAAFVSEQKARQEMADSKQWLEKVTGKPVLSFCFPGGKYNASLIGMAKETGYSSTCLVVRNVKEKEVLPSYARINVVEQQLQGLKKDLRSSDYFKFRGIRSVARKMKVFFTK